MACCKCEEHKWEDPQKTVYIDENGNEFCVFHAPEGHKGICSEEFNEIIFARIKTHSIKEFGYSCKLAGTIFPRYISFSLLNDCDKLSAIDFDSCIFCETMALDSVVFDGEILFSNSIFQNNVILNFSKISSISFHRAHINGKLYCEKSEIFIASFSSSKFTGEVNFINTKFLMEIYFSNSDFISGGSFRNVKFSDEVHFDKVIFRGIFSFRNVLFRNEVDFRFSEFETCIFHSCSFQKYIMFISICSIKNYINFSECDLYNCIFFNTDVTDISYLSSCWPIVKSRPKIAAEDELEDLEHVKDFYQRMKRKYKQEHDEAKVSQWHWAEKEAELAIMARDKRVSFTRVALWLYRLSSRFGEDAARAGVLLGWLVAFVGLLLVFGGIADGQATVRIETWPWTWTWSGAMLEKIGILLKTLLLNLLLVTPDSIPFKPVHELAGAAVLFLTRLLIPIQAALFAFALRNRFRR